MPRVSTPDYSIQETPFVITSGMPVHLPDDFCACTLANGCFYSIFTVFNCRWVHFIQQGEAKTLILHCVLQMLVMEESL